MFWAFLVANTLMASLGFYMMYHKRLKRHPYQLYAIEMLLGSCAAFFLISPVIAASFPITRMLMATVKFDPRILNPSIKINPEYYVAVIENSWIFNELMAPSFLALKLTAYTILFLDIYFIVKDPFKP